MKEKEQGSLGKPLLMFVISMLIFGTVALAVRNIGLPSSVIAMSRGIIGALFLFAAMAAAKKRPDMTAIRKNLIPLIASGISLGINWILLFEAYRYTSIAVATLCYYLEPVLLILSSPFVFREKLTAPKLICSAAALAGMVLVSGVFEKNGTASGDGKTGILFGIGAAIFYCCVVTFTKKTDGLDPFDCTLVQLIVSAVVLLPYNILSGAFSGASLSVPNLLWLAVAGIVHTGIAYLLYFGAVCRLPAQTAAIFSYIDPASAILISVIIGESFSPLSAFGALLILGSTLIYSIFTGKPKNRK